MAEEPDEKVKVGLELPKEQVSVEPADKEPEASYTPADVTKALVEPPEPKSKTPPNAHQKAVMLFGFSMVAVSLVLWPLVNFAVGVAVAIAGAAVIAFGTLVRI